MPLLFTRQNRKIINFRLKNLPLQNIVPHLMFIYGILSHFLKFKYSLKGIVIPKLTRRNEISWI